MRHFGSAFAAALLLSVPASLPVTAQTVARPAPLAELVKAVDIPFEQFTLANGLRVIVHTDRKAPVVAVSVWYHVGSRFEPKGKTGFAHLFEHLMFNGSENADEDFFKPLESVGATDLNGTTWFDRTNYFQTVPTGALDLTLFLEADRMGHLLGAVTQEKLDNQRGVVQNEKRQGDNQPYGLVEYAQLAALFPEGHPYRHSTIGSMADLEAASLETVRDWFRDHYGPNNAVLVLAGDIDAATARAKVERWFGSIARGPDHAAPPADVPTLKADVEKLMHDRIATTRLSRSWVVPGVNDDDMPLLGLSMSVLGGLSSSRLDNILVRDEKTAVAVSASLQPFEKVGMIEVTVDVRPGADPAAVDKRLDAIIADYLKSGPTADEVSRAATRVVAGTIAGLEKVGGRSGKAVTLAEGAVYSGDPARYKQDLAAFAAATPDAVATATRKWLGRPVLRLTVAPGERTAEDIALAGGTDVAPRPAAAPTDDIVLGKADGTDLTPRPATTAAASPPPQPQDPTKPKIAAPPVAPVADLEFPAVERATLSNGVNVLFARRATVPTVRVAVSFDAGNAADSREKPGTAALMRSLLDEGTRTRSSIQIAEEQERLGANLSASSGMDTTSVGLFALKPNLAPSLDLLADIVRNPAFAPAEVDRLRGQLLTGIAAEKTQPNGIARRLLPPLIYGRLHPYGIPLSGSGTEEGVKAVTRDDLVTYHATWIRPDNATIFAVGDTTLGELTPLLEARFGNWRAPAAAKGTKLFRMDRMARVPRIILVDRPQSPQSVILGGEVLGMRGTDDPLPLITANEVLGGSFLSRLNMDLRETKGWAYGVGTQAAMVKDQMPFFVSAPVQADRTGDSMKALIAGTETLLGPQPITEEERDRTINNQIRSLPGSFETSSDLLGAIVRNATFGRPDDYYARLPERYRAMTGADLQQALKTSVDPRRLIWVVVGDAKVVRPQLESLGLPVEERQPE